MSTYCAHTCCVAGTFDEMDVEHLDDAADGRTVVCQTEALCLMV